MGNSLTALTIPPTSFVILCEHGFLPSYEMAFKTLTKRNRFLSWFLQILLALCSIFPQPLVLIFMKLSTIMYCSPLFCHIHEHFQTQKQRPWHNEPHTLLIQLQQSRLRWVGFISCFFSPSVLSSLSILKQISDTMSFSPYLKQYISI